MKPITFSAVTVVDLVDLQRQQDRGRDERQVLGPALGVPEPDRLDALEQPVGEQRDPNPAQRPRAQREQLVELVQDADVARGLHRTAGDPALEAGEDPVVSAAQARSLRGEQRARRCRAGRARRSETHGRSRSAAGRPCRAVPCRAAAATISSRSGGCGGSAPSGGGSATQLSQRRHRCQRTPSVVARDQVVLAGAARRRRCRPGRGPSSRR